MPGRRRGHAGAVIVRSRCPVATRRVSPLFPLRLPRGTASLAEPAWHRRLRARRQRARQLLRVEAACIALDGHHGSQLPHVVEMAWKYGWNGKKQNRRRGPWTACACQEAGAWLFDDRIDTTTTCSKCGDSMYPQLLAKSGGNQVRAVKPAAASAESREPVPQTIKDTYDLAKTAGNDNIVAHCEKNWPSLAAKAKPVGMAVQEASKKAALAGKKFDRALTRLESVLDQLKEAKEALAVAHKEKDDADREHEEVKQRYDAAVGLGTKARKDPVAEGAAAVLDFGDAPREHPKVREFAAQWQAAVQDAQRKRDDMLEQIRAERAAAAAAAAAAATAAAAAAGQAGAAGAVGTSGPTGTAGTAGAATQGATPATGNGEGNDDDEDEEMSGERRGAKKPKIDDGNGMDDVGCDAAHGADAAHAGADDDGDDGGTDAETQQQRRRRLVAAAKRRADALRLEEGTGSRCG